MDLAATDITVTERAPAAKLNKKKLKKIVGGNLDDDDLRDLPDLAIINLFAQPTIPVAQAELPAYITQLGQPRTLMLRS